MRSLILVPLAGLVLVVLMWAAKPAAQAEGYGIPHLDLPATQAPVAHAAAGVQGSQGLYGWIAGYWGYTIARHSDAWLLALGQCEQGDRWDVYGPTYEGHFGMLAALWDRVRRPEWPDNMGAADWAQQLAGVRIANALVGDRAWGCASRANAAVPSG